MSFVVGELDQRVTIERVTLTPDGAGGATESWATVATLWAKVRPLSGAERGQSQAQREEAVAEYLVVIRNRDDVRDTDRIGWGDRKLNIAFRKDRGHRADYLELVCVMGRAG